MERERERVRGKKMLRTTPRWVSLGFRIELPAVRMDRNEKGGDDC